MTNDESTPVLDIPAYRIQHIQQPETGLAVRIDDNVYIRDPEEDAIAPSRFVYNSWDGLVNLILAILNDHGLLTHGEGEFTVRQRSEFGHDHS